MTTNRLDPGTAHDHSAYPDPAAPRQGRFPPRDMSHRSDATTMAPTQIEPRSNHMQANPTTTFRSGLEGVVAAQTRLSHVDGQKGQLIVGGYPIEDLAPNATFEEAVYLLWHDRLPNAPNCRPGAQSWQPGVHCRRPPSTCCAPLPPKAAPQWTFCAWQQGRWTWSCRRNAERRRAWGRCSWPASPR